MTKMMKKGTVDVAKLMTAAMWKGEEIKKSDLLYNKKADQIVIDAGSTRLQEVLHDFGFETC